MSRKNPGVPEQKVALTLEMPVFFGLVRKKRTALSKSVATAIYCRDKGELLKAESEHVTVYVTVKK